MVFVFPRSVTGLLVHLAVGFTLYYFLYGTPELNYAFCPLFILLWPLFVFFWFLKWAVIIGLVVGAIMLMLYFYDELRWKYRAKKARKECTLRHREWR
jgi:signal transduction histidine kinase